MSRATELFSLGGDNISFVLLSTALLFGADPTFKPPSVNGTWQYSDDLYMTITLALKGDAFEYLLISDFGDQEPKPIRGKVLYRSNSIQLVPPEGEDNHFYSTTWRLVVSEGEICLLADRDLPDHRPPKSPSGRLLYKVADDVPPTQAAKQPPTGK